MIQDRRDYCRRAETMRRVVERLIQEAHGVEAGGVAAGGVTESSTASRILRRLALRGLARKDGGRWTPSPVLRKAPALEPCD